MDSLITAAARALALGDPLGALKRVALREDPPALALRGIAMAQLTDFVRAKSLLKRAARAFGPRESMSRARCIVAEAEVALASRDLNWPTKSLDAARAVLEAHGDKVNAAYANQLKIRRLVLIGRLEEAERLIEPFDAAHLPPALVAAHELVIFAIAIRRLRTSEARAALARAQQSAHIAGVPALIAEAESATRVFEVPAAQLIGRGGKRVLFLDEVEALNRSRTLIVDACRLAVRDQHAAISLARRPILLALARTLAEAWPQDVPRNALISAVFRTKRPDESHRVRLRVEMGRLRTAIKPLADVNATREGFIIAPKKSDAVAVLIPPLEDENASVLALLADGETWSSSAVALALGTSQRNVQRALESLASNARIQALGSGRSRRWIAAPLPGFATPLLLPGLFPGD